MGRTADSLFHALTLDTVPQTAGVRNDFGLDGSEEESKARYAALQRAVRERGVTADQLHAASNNASKLNALVNNEADFTGMPGNLFFPELQLRDREAMHKAISAADRIMLNEFVMRIVDQLRWDSDAGEYDPDLEVSGADTVEFLVAELENMELLPES